LLLLLQSVRIRESKFGQALVLETTAQSGSYVLGFKVDPKETLDYVFKEISSLWEVRAIVCAAAAAAAAADRSSSSDGSSSGGRTLLAGLKHNERMRAAACALPACLETLNPDRTRTDGDRRSSRASRSSELRFSSTQTHKRGSWTLSG
jgi:hypothetical protein